MHERSENKEKLNHFKYLPKEQILDYKRKWLTFGK